MFGYDCDPSGLQALVVDDDTNMRLLARATLESIGFEVLEARDGEEAWQILESEHPDVVLLDVLMPGIDGFEVCENLRQKPDFENLPVIMMTGLDDLGSVNRAYEAGATDFVGKPVNWELLKYRVRYTIRASIAFRGLANAQRLARLGSWSWSPESARVDCSDEVYRILGIERSGTAPSYEDFSATVHDADRADVLQARERALAAGSPYDIDYRVEDAAGTIRHLQEHGEVLPATTARGPRVSGTIQEVTERRIFEQQIQHMALHDALTGLANRRMFKDRLDAALHAASRYRRRLALLYFDLDKFKRVNDTFGHDAGDLVLREVASRVSECSRGTDELARPGSDRTLARFGGDEFIVLLSEIASPEDAARVARRILDRLDEPFQLNGVPLRLTSSLGITVYPDDGDSVELLLKNADVAMYHAKAQGRNNYQFFTGELNARVQGRMTLEAELGRAIARDELELEYQPIFDLDNGSLRGVEALLRWNSAKLGRVQPDRFIRVAEEVGLIVPIGDWVLRRACAQGRRWLVRHGGTFHVAVNVSAVQLRQAGFLDNVAATLAANDLDPRHLQIELTESVLMDDVEASERLLAGLRELGVSMAIDDFGTGYSSLSYLRRFRPDSLKIDRSFVRDLGTDADADAITSAVVALARSLHLKVVAEGVETRSQLDLLRAMGCTYAQGFLLGRPGSAAAIEQILDAEGGAGLLPIWRAA